MAGIHPLLRDYLAATTYRRLDLAGRKWDAARAAAGTAPLPTPPPVRDPSGGRSRQRVAANARRLVTWQDGSRPADRLGAAEKLSLVLRHAALPLRWEPGDETLEHRGVPSAGALYPLDLVLLGGADGAEGRPRMRCSPQDLALIEEDDAAAGAWTGPVEIALVARLARAAADYGDLALALAALEAGMCVAQLRLLLALVGWPSAARPRGRRAAAGLGLGHWSDLVLARVATALPPDAVEGLPRRKVLAEAEAGPYEAAEELPLLRAVARLLAEAGDPPEPAGSDALLASKAPPGLPGLLPAMARRSSGPAEAGAARVSAGPFDRLGPLLADVLALLEASCRGSVADGAAIALVHRREALGAAECLRFDPVSGAVVRLTDGEIVRRAGGAADGAGPGLVVTIGLDEVSLIETAGPAGLLACYTAAGAIGQCFCLAAALHGMTARPLRSYDDREADLLLPIRARTFLQVRIGFPGPPRLGFPAV
ncbi:MAG: hypothetical protein JOZ90_11455 [Alphaproteobacteria bacterium]|nr:hypothetical protein [Alphaproteobacteria bacterium]MBV9372024.1 hypothetical protein [Alphaproteobacteria bacterium]MBV9901702.1 hypothetical protein [Alphaproteobacteria bacterium]